MCVYIYTYIHIYVCIYMHTFRHCHLLVVAWYWPPDRALPARWHGGAPLYNDNVSMCLYMYVYIYVYVYRQTDTHTHTHTSEFDKANNR
jgi:hypothetical protein